MSSGTERASTATLSADRRPLVPDAPAIPSPLPTVTIVLPAYNECALAGAHLAEVCAYMSLLAERYAWEVLVVDDGSTDGTDEIVADAARRDGHIRVVTHASNQGLGEALRSAFGASSSDYVLTLDMDLSYSVDHIGALLDCITRTGAKLVLASPYAIGGRVSNVPWFRHLLSRGANRFLSATNGRGPSTVTGMVRAYDGPFLRSLALRGSGMEINMEIVSATLAAGACLEEVPAHLNWAASLRSGRRSRMPLVRQVATVLRSGGLAALGRIRNGRGAAPASAVNLGPKETVK